MPPRTDQIEQWLADVKGDVEKGRTSKKCFTEQMRVYIPIRCGTDEGKPTTCKCGTEKVRSGQPCMAEVNELIATVNKLFMGSTVYDAEGSGLEGKHLVSEPVKVVETASMCVGWKDAKEFYDALTTYAKNMKQFEVGVLRGRFYINRTRQMAEATGKQATLERFR